ncbi:MAG: class I mannose-6-phosphate isomerase [Prevotellaceae bacterium]|jgi:mannose-6-phosphate isomerase|nr:class I mannose-6-phosphate isomerase [Prevotellaceae bacterium]
MLYPLKFYPIYKNYVWGGKKLAALKNNKADENQQVSESWELSAVSGNISIVANGFLSGNNLQELIEVYMGDLVGESVYEKYGMEFPLLLKFIDAAQPLSVQVHPDDEIALKRHNAYGKDEMWYIIEAANDAEICLGFNQNINGEILQKSLRDKTLLDILNFEKIKEGNVFEVPSGRIHAIGKNVLLAEVQNTSDITYRIYDWGREYDAKTARQMHVDLALDVIDYNSYSTYKTEYEIIKNKGVDICRNGHFSVRAVDFDSTIIRNYVAVDSFTAYMCVDGEAILECNGKKESMVKCETVLIPAEIDEVKLIPNRHARLLEISMY